MRVLMRFVQPKKQIEHEAFYGGSQGCRSEAGLAEIESHFNQKIETVSQEATPRIKKLEAVIEDTQSRLPAARQRLDSIMLRLGGHLPESAVPCVMVLIAIFAMLAESAMLAPFMDVFGVSEPISQRLAALAIGGACAILLHLAIESLIPGRFHLHSQRLLRILGPICVVCLALAGVARGREAAYSASLDGSPLAGFLHGNPILGMLVYAFFTVAFPVAAALAISFGAKALQEWKELLLAKRDLNALNTTFAHRAKELESEQKSLAHERSKLEQKRKEWQDGYLVYHERGRNMGACQTPWWMIWLKATVAGLVAYFFGALIFGHHSIYPDILAAIAFIATWVHYRHAWTHPKPHQLYEQQNVEFRSSDSGGEQ